MKLTFIFLFAAFMQVSAKSYTQTITLNFQNAPLEKVLKEIEKQTGYNFFYEKEVMQNAKPVTITVSKSPIDQTLAICFKEQPLEYRIVQTTIFIKRKEPSKLGQKEISVQKNGEIKGHVTNEKGEPLAGANITVKRTGKGTIADENGNFTLSDILNDDVIVISYVGYQAQSIKIGERNSITLVLGEANNELDKVVMQAYGQTTKRLNTGNIAKITAEEIEKQPVMNPLLALQGRVPGLAVTQTSGYASAPIKVEIRGRNNVNPDLVSEPLYVIDGVPLTVLEIGGGNYSSGSLGFLQNGGLVGPASGQSPLFSINPNDIESIEILKDADATAIYGSRGANGVILITTKKGKAGKSILDINVYQGITKVTRFWKMLGTRDYVNMRKEAFYNDSITFGITPNSGNAYDILTWDTTRYTNWQKVLWGGTGKTTNAQMSLSGGDSRTSFRIGAGYNYQKSFLAATGADQKGSFSINLIHKINEHIDLSLTSLYCYTKSDMITLPSGAATLPPNAPPIYDSTGKLNYAGWAPAQTTFPFATLLQPYTSKTGSLISNFSLNYHITKGLTFRVNAGYTSTQAEQSYLTTIASQDPAQNPTGYAQFGNNNIKNWIVEPQLEYRRFIGKGNLNVLIGGTEQNNVTEGTFINAFGFTDDALIKSPSNASSTTSSSTYGQYKYNAIFGRVTYNWLNKYMVNFTGRRDGSSRFGPGNQFGNFGAIGGAWIFSEEKFIKTHLHFLNFGKLRTSYGSTGSDLVGEYQYLTRWSSNGIPSYGGGSSFIPLQHANTDYHWQLNRKLEVAVDLGFLESRILLSGSWYRNRCSNQLVPFPTAQFTGFSSVTANSPASVENSGLEFTASFKVIQNKVFSWSVFSNIGINRNKLLSYPNLSQSPYFGLFEIGKPLNIRKLLHWTGVDRNSGLNTFEDKNKDGQTSINPDSTSDLYSIDLSPKYSGGIGTNFRFKELEINLFFNFIKQKGNSALYSTHYPGTIANQPTEILNHNWAKQGDASNVARFTTVGDATDYYMHVYSDAVFTDASFLRLQNISISYLIPKKIISKKSLEQVKVYLQGQNIFTITKYKGIDPETQNFGSLPTAKIFTGGIQFIF